MAGVKRCRALGRVPLPLLLQDASCWYFVDQRRTLKSNDETRLGDAK
jgi:hypothetical protein